MNVYDLDGDGDGDGVAIIWICELVSLLVCIHKCVYVCMCMLYDI